MIRLKGVTQVYHGASGPVEALRGVDLAVQEGEIFGVIGRSGAGKSSLVRTINLLNRPSAGEVWVGGQELTALDGDGLRAARRGIGMVFQHFNLLSSRTVFDNVALPLELAGIPSADIRRRVEPLLDRVGLGGLGSRYPAQISGGQKQRVGIARALAGQARVLLSDEATSALDPETTRTILDLLRDIQRELKLTVVLITHEMQVIKQVAERVAVLEAGRIVEQGDTLQVFSRPAHDVTRTLVADVVPQSLPVRLLERARSLMQAHPETSRLWRITFAGSRSEAPLLAGLIRDHGLDVSILYGQVDEIQGEPFGSLALQVSGPDASRAGARQQLVAAGVEVEEVSCE